MFNMKTQYKGFTLIEILVVVALIAILAAITIIAINPAKNFADARDASRRSDVTTILNAVSQYVVDGGTLAADAQTDVIPNCPATIEIGTDVTVGDYYDLNEGDRMIPTYLVGMPYDPSTGTVDTQTSYTICQQGASGRFQVAALADDGVTAISVQR
jgi:prepilin-type N-terminal cleavage/methylation domain-containing protein